MTPKQSQRYEAFILKQNSKIRRAREIKKSIESPVPTRLENIGDQNKSILESDPVYSKLDVAFFYFLNYDCRIFSDLVSS